MPASLASPPRRAMMLRSGMSPKVTGQVSRVKRKTVSASKRRRKMGRIALRPMDTSPITDSAVAIFRGYMRGVGMSLFAQRGKYGGTYIHGQSAVLDRRVRHQDKDEVERRSDEPEHPL